MIIKKLKIQKILDNALLRENFQRNHLYSAIKNFNDDTFVLISDVDEIPNLKISIFQKCKITFFEQKMYYYKFNLLQ